MEIPWNDLLDFIRKISETIGDTGSTIFAYGVKAQLVEGGFSAAYAFISIIIFIYSMNLLTKKVNWFNATNDNFTMDSAKMLIGLVLLIIGFFIFINNVPDVKRLFIPEWYVIKDILDALK